MNLRNAFMSVCYLTIGFFAVIVDLLSVSARSLAAYHREQGAIRTKWYRELQSVAKDSFNGELAINANTSDAESARRELLEALELLDVTIRFRSLWLSRDDEFNVPCAQVAYDHEMTVVKRALENARDAHLPVGEYLDAYPWSDQAVV